MDLLLYFAVGVWAVLTLALIIALGWLLDDRAHARSHARRAEMRGWYYKAERATLVPRANRENAK